MQEEIITINGEGYSLLKYGGQSTMYIWAAAHVCSFEQIQWNDFIAQGEFLERIKPDVVLHEFLLNFIYDPETKRYTNRDTGEPAIDFQIKIARDNGRILMETKAIIDRADRLEHKVIGCDRWAAHFLEVSDEEREIEQADVIEKYNGTRQKPRVSIIGAIHCLPDSYLNCLLQRKGLCYAVIHKLENVKLKQLCYA